MRIVHVAASKVPVLHRFGGASQRRVMELAKRQVARGHSVIVYSTGERNETIQHEGVEIRFRRPRAGLKIGLIELQLRLVGELLKSRSTVDFMHFHGQPEGAAIAKLLPAKKVLSFDYFYFRRGLRGPLFHAYRRFLNMYDRLLPVSQFCLEGAQAHWRFPANKAEVLFNGVNTDQFSVNEEAGRAERQALGLNGQIILYVGRVNQQKGTDLLLEAYRKLRQEMDEVHLVIAGPIGQFGHGESTESSWPDEIRDAGGIYLGTVEESRLAAVYNMADIFVMPTRQYEMFGMAAAEAQACGKPVIASDHGGLREVVPLDCGGRFPVGDVGALTGQLRRLLTQPESYRLASQRALANSRRFDWAVIEDQLQGIISSLVKEA